MMKKAISSLMAVLLLALTLTGCINAEPATDFSAKEIDNGYYNFLNGGKLAYHDHNLYYVAENEILMTYYHTYIINESGDEKMFADDHSGDWSVASPKLYQSGDKLFVLNYDENYVEKVYQYQYDTKELELSLEWFYDGPGTAWARYDSEQLSVWADYDDNGDSVLTVRYRDNDPYQIKDFDDFTVYHDVIYYWDRGSIYRNDPAKDEKSECFLELKDSPYSFLASDRYCYYTVEAPESDYDNAVAALYRYSFDDKKKVKLGKKDIRSMNVIGDHLYCGGENGVYTDDGKELKKISDIHAREVYIVDEKWIYLTDDDMHLYRITHDGSVTEQVKLNDLKTDQK